MPRSLMPVAVITGMLVVPALAAVPLDGWGAYKFGMSPDAARAVPGQTFGLYSPKNLLNENKGAMGARKPSMLYGFAWAFNLFFADDKMNALSLENEKRASLADCEKTFLSVLGQSEKTYGAFAPVNPERMRNESDTPPTSLEWKTQGASRYQLATLTLDDEYAYAWKARKSQGGNYVELTATWSGPPKAPSAPCVTDINFSGK